MHESRVVRAVQENFGLRNLYGLATSDPSDASGYASFHNLNFLDAITGCYRIMFVVVLRTTPTSSYAISAVSQPLCVTNVDTMTISQEPPKASAQSVLPQMFSYPP